MIPITSVLIGRRYDTEGSDVRAEAMQRRQLQEPEKTSKAIVPRECGT